MDSLQAACQLPKLAERAMRAAIVRAIARGRMTPRTLVDDALLRFETQTMERIGIGIRPALLFSERDRIVRELRAFIDGRLAARLAALRAGAVLAAGRDAAPFDLIVKNRRGVVYAVLLRRLAQDGRRLETMRRVRQEMKRMRTPVSGVLVYDFVRGNARLVLDQAGAQGMDRHLRAS
jgi:hypothetical protein